MRVKRQRIFREIGTGATSSQQYIERYHPQRPMSLESEFVVPLFVSIVVGFLFALLATFGIIHLAPDLTLWRAFVVLFLAITGIAFVFKHNAASETCWDVEHIPLEPELEPAPVTERSIVVTAPNARSFPEPVSVEEPDAVVDQELDDFRLFVQMAAVSTAARRMNRRFGRKRANAMRQALMDAGLAEWKGEPNSTAGWRLLHEESVVQESLCRIELPDST